MAGRRLAAKARVAALAAVSCPALPVAHGDLQAAHSIRADARRRSVALHFTVAMTNKTILITGCSTGIGRHCALRLARGGGWRVLASARKDGDLRELESRGLVTVRIDVGDPGGIEEGFARAVDLAGGRIDAVFNNAGFGIVGALEDVGADAMREIFDANVIGLHEMNRLAVRHMRGHGGGRIVLNSSVLGFVSTRFRGAYCATKHAVEALAQALRLELEGTGISVISLQPGPVTSRFRDNAMAMHFRHVRRDGSPFLEDYRRIEAAWKEGRRSRSEQAFTLGPEAVHKALVKALEADSPRAQYRITVPTSLFWWLKRALPTRLLDAVISRI